MRRAIILAFVILAAPRLGLAQSVGVRELTVVTAERNEPVHATLWYPAMPGGNPILVGENAVFRGVAASQDAPASEGRFPLVVIAHGGFRSAPNAASWLAVALASRGFVAAVVIPPALPEGQVDPSVLNELWLRPADVSATITAVEKDPGLAGHIDASKIAGVGFFLGGHSVLALAGARLDPGAYTHSCDIANERDCKWFAGAHVDLKQVNPTLLGRSNLDSRLKLAIAIDPELSFYLTEGSLRAITVPVRIINLGPLSEIQRTVDASKPASMTPGARYQTIQDAGRFSSFPECKPKGPAILASEGGETELCEDGGAKPRSAIHDEMSMIVIEIIRQSFGNN